MDGGVMQLYVDAIINNKMWKFSNDIDLDRIIKICLDIVYMLNL
jgi:hypothetical protein